MSGLQAITREVSRSIARCELTHFTREPIDLEVARIQHDRYEQALVAAGCRVERLDEEPELPDAVFVEDTALVLDEVAVVLRPGAASRRPETRSVAQALGRFRELRELGGPGTIDGGDLLRLGRTILVGRSSRSDAAGVAELGDLLRPFGYTVRAVAVEGCLHLKSAITALDSGTVLVNPDWFDVRQLVEAGEGDRKAAIDVLKIDPAEPNAANALSIGGRLIFPETFPRTASRLLAAGFDLVPVDLSELAKAEGAVTCCSLVFGT